jgi:hypothetical protein
MSPGELPLGSGPTPSGPEKYEHKLAVYAAKYGTHLRNLKNWIAIGKQHQDKPPLDRPDLMPEWWSRRMQHRVPEKIISLARQFVAETTLPSEPTAHVCTPPPIGAPSVASQGADSKGANMGSSLDRLREAEGAASAAYVAAVAALSAGTGDEGDVEIKQRRWERAADMLRKAETAYFKLADIKGDNLPRRDVARYLQEIHSSLSESLRGLVERVRPKLSGKTEQEQDLIWNLELDRAFLVLPHELGL